MERRLCDNRFVVSFCLIGREGAREGAREAVWAVNYSNVAKRIFSEV